ncbi:hypothetical protein LK10_20650, partial [Sinomonas humi]
MPARRVTGVPSPRDVWALAPLIAGQPSYRSGQWVRGKFGYPGSPVGISSALPKSPAAVLVHGADGSVATLCLDLDTSSAAQHVVDGDAERLGALLASCGLRWVEDVSPSGGRHLYVPLAERMDGAQARELVEALARVARSLDASPHRNPSTGCIRVPGTLHKRGGRQELVTPLSAAYEILRRRNTAEGLERLRRALAPELRRNRHEAGRRARLMAPPPAQTGRSPGPDTAGRPLGGWQSPLRSIAETGLYETDRYRSVSY